MPRSPPQKGAGSSNTGKGVKREDASSAQEAAEIRNKKRKAADSLQDPTHAGSAFTDFGAQEEIDAEPAKRGRGRPRKDGQPPKSKAAVDVDKPAATRGRGRPRKEEADAKAEENMKELAATRGRGRPRKETLESEEKILAKKTNTDAANKTKEPATEPKRGRGRPRKETA